MKDTYEGLGGFHDDSYNQVRTFDDLVLRIDTIFDEQKSGTSYFDYQLRFLLKLIINYSRHRDGKTTDNLVEIDKALEFLNISQGDSQSVVNQGIDKLIKYLYGSKVVFITSEVNTIPLTPGKEDNYYWNKANNNLYLYRNGRYINMGGYKPNTIYIKLFENEKHLYIRATDTTLENVSEKFIKVETVLGITPDANKDISFKLSEIENDTNYVTKPYVDTHIVNKSNPHNVTKEQVGLGNVDNTPDLNKPISTATQNALNTKLNVLDVKSEVIYQDLKPVNSQAVMNWSTQKINNIAELRQTIGKEEGQVVELLGYYEAGEYSLKYKWTNTQETDDGGAVINVSNGSWIAQFKENKIIIDFFGAKTSITDNTPYINNAINYCNSIATITNEVNLIVPDSNGTYKCANKLTKINRYINLKCYSELELTSVINDVFIEIGDYLNNGSNVGRSHIIRAFRTNFSNLSQIYDKLNNVGVRLINDSTSNNSIVKIWGFYIGLELYGSYETSYNKYYLTKLACNVIDIDLNKQANGWINENIFFGGSFSLFSGESNKLYKKHCVRVRSNDDYKNNSNLMIKPSFEAHPNGVPNDSYVIRLDNASGFKIIDARLESTPTFFAYEGVDNRGFYSFTYIHNTSVSTNITKIKAPNGSTSIVENNMNKGSYFYNSGDLSEKIKSTSSITVFKDTLGFMAASVDEKLLTKTSSKTSGGVVLNNDKTLKTNIQGVALTIKNINEGDSFFVKLNSLSGGRIFIKAYNNLGEVIDYGVGTSFQLFDESSSYPSRFGVCWGLQSDIEKTSFSVTSSDVSKVVLLFRSNDLISFLVNKIEGKNACIDNSHKSSSLYSHRVNTSASLTVDSLTDYIRVNNLTSNITLSLPVDTTNSLSNIRIRLDNLNGYNVVVSTGASSRTFNKNNTNIYMFKSETYYQFEGVYSDMVSSSNVENVTSADATDLTTALTLVNELKSKLNAKLTADRNSGQQAIQ